MMAAPTIGSLFAGIGGFDAGFRDVGMETRWACEIDPVCRDVFARHFPESRLYTDVRELDGGDIDPVDVICFGSPCQDLSVAGLRRGLAGERSGLFREAVRIIRQMREATDERFPRVVVWENVPGAYSSAGGDDFEVVLRELAASGAVDLAWRTLNTDHFAPQNRRRVFVLALYPPAAEGRAGIGRAAEILALPESLSWHPRAGEAAREGVAGGAADGAGGSGQDTAMTLSPGAHPGGFNGQDVGNLLAFAWQLPGGLDTETHGPNRQHIVRAGEYAGALGATRMDAIALLPDVAGTLGGGSGHRGIPDDLDRSGAFIPTIAHALRAEGADASDDGTGRGTPIIAFDTTQITSVTNRSDPQPGAPCHTLTGYGDAPAIAVDLRNQSTGEAAGALHSNGQSAGTGTAVAFTERTRADGRNFEAQDELAYALTNPGGGGRAHSRSLMTPQMAVRRLTPTECERLQGFPDGWTAVGAKGKPLADAPRYRMLGNAVSPPVARWIGERLAAALVAAILGEGVTA